MPVGTCQLLTAVFDRLFLSSPHSPFRCVWLCIPNYQTVPVDRKYDDSQALDVVQYVSNTTWGTAGPCDVGEKRYSSFYCCFATTKKTCFLLNIKLNG